MGREMTYLPSHGEGRTEKGNEWMVMEMSTRKGAIKGMFARTLSLASVTSHPGNSA